MTAPISNGPTTHGYTTMRDATPLDGENGTKLSLHAGKASNWAILSEQGEFCTGNGAVWLVQGEFCTGSGTARL